jgi:hypothetical protein
MKSGVQIRASFKIESAIAVDKSKHLTHMQEAIRVEGLEMQLNK